MVLFLFCRCTALLGAARRPMGPMLVPLPVASIVACVVYLATQRSSRTRASLTSVVMNVETSSAFFNTWVAFEPRLMEWSMQCYHNERRGHGDADRRARVNTHSCIKQLPVKCVADRTDLPRQLAEAERGHTLNIVSCPMDYEFVTDIHHYEHGAEYSAWIAENDRDRHYNAHAKLVRAIGKAK